MNEWMNSRMNEWMGEWVGGRLAGAWNDQRREMSSMYLRNVVKRMEGVRIGIGVRLWYDIAGAEANPFIAMLAIMLYDGVILLSLEDGTYDVIMRAPTHRIILEKGENT